MPKAIRHTLLALALATLPVLAAAQSYPSGTSQQPAATPSTPPAAATQNSVNRSGNSDYGQAIAACEQKPMSERVACRQAADAKFGKGGGDTSGNTTSGGGDTSGNTTSGSATSGTGTSSGSATGGMGSSTGSTGSSTGSSSGTGASSGTGTSGK